MDKTESSPYLLNILLDAGLTPSHAEHLYQLYLNHTLTSILNDVELSNEQLYNLESTNENLEQNISYILTEIYSSIKDKTSFDQKMLKWNKNFLKVALVGINRVKKQNILERIAIDAPSFLVSI